jgi:indolepyruvate ferredoxin oxidoreductase, beta subunit
VSGALLNPDSARVQRRPTNMIFTGVGGQGNVLAAKLVAATLLEAGQDVAVGDVFGLSQRGGSVASHVRFWTHGPVPPLISRGHLDILIGFEPLETLRILCEFGTPETVVLLNTVPIPPVGVLMGRTTYPPLEDLLEATRRLAKRLVAIDGVALAHEAGDAQGLNVVMVGALIGLGLLPIELDAMRAELSGSVSARFLEMNLRALDLGWRASCPQE